MSNTMHFLGHQYVTLSMQLFRAQRVSQNSRPGLYFSSHRGSGGWIGGWVPTTFGGVFRLGFCVSHVGYGSRGWEPRFPGVLIVPG